MGAVVPVITGIGAAVGVIGHVSAGRAASRAGEANARADLEMAAIQERMQRENDQRVIAASLSQIGGTGVEFAGSPLEVQRQSMAAAERNAFAIRREGELKAEADRRAGKDAARAEYFGAAGSTLEAVSMFGPRLLRNRPRTGGASPLGDYPSPSVDLG